MMVNFGSSVCPFFFCFVLVLAVTGGCQGLFSPGFSARRILSLAMRLLQRCGFPLVADVRRKRSFCRRIKPAAGTYRLKLKAVIRNHNFG